MFVILWYILQRLLDTCIDTKDGIYFIITLYDLHYVNLHLAYIKLNEFCRHLSLYSMFIFDESSTFQIAVYLTSQLDCLQSAIDKINIIYFFDECLSAHISTEFFYHLFHVLGYIFMKKIYSAVYLPISCTI